MSDGLKHRRLQPELMDDPSLDRKLHEQALVGLRRVNSLSRTTTVFERAIVKSGVLDGSTSEPLRILDIACGGGDLVVQLANRLHRRGCSVEIDGCDISPVAIEVATQQARDTGCNRVNFFQHDVLQDTLAQSYDVVMCSLFLHHLDESDALTLLAFMRQTASQLVLVDDLQRTRFGYWLAWTGCRLLSRCYVVHVDGPRSVEGAFTVAEAKGLALRAEWCEPKIDRHWPERFLMSCRIRS
ncbi:MAG: methyltransferase domain-containing protein [Planctomycetaceae bacterium]